MWPTAAARSPRRIAITTQYTTMRPARAGTTSVYGGGCIDYGAAGGSTCNFGDTTATGPGHDYLAAVVSDRHKPVPRRLSGDFDERRPNDICLTDPRSGTRWQR